jgi:hypothetical protein
MKTALPDLSGIEIIKSRPFTDGVVVKDLVTDDRPDGMAIVQIKNRIGKLHILRN